MTSTSTVLSATQLSIGPVAAATATGDVARLTGALNRALDAGLTVSEAKEVLVQLYAYVGFPRSLNALGQLMKVLDDRRTQGITDPPGKSPSPVPTGAALLAEGTANQTRLSGGPVKGPLFDFAPAVDQFLKTHLFGDIFARDNLDWQSRELATVSALAAMTGVESQLLSHIRISMNTGLNAEQLRLYAHELQERDEGEASRRVVAALETHLGGSSPQ